MALVAGHGTCIPVFFHYQMDFCLSKSNPCSNLSIRRRRRRTYPASSFSSSPSSFPSESPSPPSPPPPPPPPSASSFSSIDPIYEEATLSVDLETISSEEQFEEVMSEASSPKIINWMAAWCRKCIYLKPKLEKLAAEYPMVKFFCVDVNSVPQSLVRRADVTRMPTIQLWKDGEKYDEVIGGHKAWLVINEVREMLQNHNI